MKKCDADRKIRGQKMIKIYSNHVRRKYGANTTETWNEAGMILGFENYRFTDEFSELVTTRFNRLIKQVFKNR